MVNNIGTNTIETERLVLRRFKLDDYKDFYREIGSDEEVSKYVEWDKHKDESVTKELLENWVKEYEEDYTFRWCVTLKDSGELIGSIDCVHKKVKYCVCEIGYVYGSKYWGKGYATEALKAVIDYLFNEANFHTIVAMHMANNPASGKVMQKAGMKYEGTLRDRIIDKTTKEYDDILSYSISKEDIDN